MGPSVTKVTDEGPTLRSRDLEPTKSKPVETKSKPPATKSKPQRMEFQTIRNEIKTSLF
jgi:hypothetical protein